MEPSWSQTNNPHVRAGPISKLSFKLWIRRSWDWFQLSLIQTHTTFEVEEHLLRKPNPMKKGAEKWASIDVLAASMILLWPHSWVCFEPIQLVPHTFAPKLSAIVFATIPLSRWTYSVDHAEPSWRRPNEILI